MYPRHDCYKSQRNSNYPLGRWDFLVKFIAAPQLHVPQNLYKGMWKSRHGYTADLLYVTVCRTLVYLKELSSFNFPLQWKANGTKTQAQVYLCSAAIFGKGFFQFLWKLIFATESSSCKKQPLWIMHVKFKRHLLIVHIDTHVLGQC